MRLREGDDRPSRRSRRPRPAARSWRCAGSTSSAWPTGWPRQDPAAGVRPPSPARRLPKALPLARRRGDPRGSRLGRHHARPPRPGPARGAVRHRRPDQRGGRARRRRRRPGGRHRRCCAARAGRSGSSRSAPTPSTAVDAYLTRARPELAAVGTARASRRALPERARGPAVAPVGLDRAGQGRRPGRGDPRRLTAYAETFVCDASARGGSRCARGPGAAGACVGDHDADLHPGHRGQPEGGVRRCSPTSALTPRTSHIGPSAHSVRPTLFANRHSSIPSDSYRGSAGRYGPTIAGLGRGCGFDSNLSGVPLRKNRRDATLARSQAFRVSEWSVRRKVVAVLAIPVVLAAVFGGLRVSSELTDASGYSTNQQRATVLEPAINYLCATERLAAAVVPVRQTRRRRPFGAVLQGRRPR